MTANPTSDHSGSVAAQWPVANAETSTVTLKLHTPGPIPPIGDDDDEDDEDGGRGSGGGGGSIDPDDDDDAPDDDEDDEETLWADGPIRVIVVVARRFRELQIISSEWLPTVPRARLG